MSNIVFKCQVSSIKNVNPIEINLNILILSNYAVKLRNVLLLDNNFNLKLLKITFFRFSSNFLKHNWNN